MKNIIRKGLILVNIFFLLLFTVSNVNAKADMNQETLKRDLKDFIANNIDHPNKKNDIEDPEEEIRVIVQLDKKSTIEQCGKDYSNEVKKRKNL